MKRRGVTLLLLPLLAFLLSACGTTLTVHIPTQEEMASMDGRDVAHVTCTAFVSLYTTVEKTGMANAAAEKLKDLISLMATHVEDPNLRAAVLQAKKAAEENPVQTLDLYRPVVKGCTPYL